MMETSIVNRLSADKPNQRTFPSSQPQPTKRRIRAMKLDKNEKELLSSFERGEWKSVKDLSRVKKHYQEVATETLRKDKRINIRLSQKDLEGIQAKAAREGMPYQTLISSIIHKFVLGGLKES